MKRPLIATGLALFVISGPTRLTAQDPSRLSFQATVGPGAGTTSGEYHSNHRGAAADLLALARFGSGAKVAMVGGVSAGIQSPGPVTDVCMGIPDGGCLPGFPEFKMISLVAGIASRNGHQSVLLGPGVARGEIRNASRGVVVLTARYDFAFPVAGPLSLAMSVRGHLVPSYRRDRFGLIAAGGGLHFRL